MGMTETAIKSLAVDRISRTGRATGYRLGNYWATGAEWQCVPGSIDESAVEISR